MFECLILLVILKMKISTSKLVKPIILLLSSTFIWFPNDKVYIGRFSLNSLPISVFVWVCSKGTSNFPNVKARSLWSKLINTFISFSDNFYKNSSEMLVGFCTYSRFILGTEMCLSASDLPSVKSLLEKIDSQRRLFKSCRSSIIPNFFVGAGLVRWTAFRRKILKNCSVFYWLD